MPREQRPILFLLNLPLAVSACLTGDLHPWPGRKGRATFARHFKGMLSGAGMERDDCVYVAVASQYIREIR